MNTALVLALALSQGPALSCPVMGNAISGKPAEVIEFGGVQYGTCCKGCGATFLKDPAKALKGERVKGKTVGTGLFDPVSGIRIDLAKAAAWADHEGVRYPFSSTANRDAFQKEPKKYAVTPKQEALFCPVMSVPVASMAKAHAFADHEGVRYYLCCGGCDSKFKANPSAFVANAKGKTAPVKARMIAAG